MQRDTEQLKDPWKTLLQQAGIAQIWTWQAEVLQAWELAHSTIARIPLGGGKGFCALLMAQQAPTETVIVCSNPKLALHRQKQAQELGWPTTLWDGTDAFPEAPQQPLLTWSDALNVRDDGDIDWQSHPVQRVILDGLPPTEKAPSWWVKMTVLPLRWIFPTDALEATWLKELDQDSWKELNIETETKEMHWLDTSEECPPASSWYVGTPDPEDSPETWLAQIPMGSNPPFALQAPQQIKMAEPPSSLVQLGILGRRCSNLQLAPQQAHQKATSTTESPELRDALKEWLAEQAHPTQIATHYSSAGDLLQQLGHPVTPQPAFERGVHQLKQTLKQFSDEGLINDLQEVSFHIKIHSIGRFKPKSLQDFPELLAFWEAYDAMRQGLSPLESLKLTFFDGKSFDLRLFAEKLPYDVATLNSLFQKLQEHKLAIVTLGATPQHQRFDQEYQLSILPHTQTSPAIPLWQESQKHRTALLWSSLNTTPHSDDESLRSLLNKSPNTVEFWQSGSQLVQQAVEQKRLISWAGRLLQQIEKHETSGLLALWALTSQELEIPSITTTQLLTFLPPVAEVTEALLPALQPLLKKHLSKEQPPQEIYNYALALPSSFGFDALVEGYLTQESDNILSIASADSNTKVLQRYTSLAQRQLGNTEIPEGTTDTRVEFQPTKPWSSAVGWAHSLLGQSKQAWQWVGGSNPEGPQETLRGVTIALDTKQPQIALQWLEGSTINDRVTSSQFAELYRQLFAICKAQARCKACSLQATSFCPSGLNTLIGLAEQRREMPLENFQYCLAKRIRADLEGNSTEQLREVLGTQIGQQSERIQRAILSQLAQRKEANLDELKRLADWAESHGDYRNAQKYRETIKEQDATDPNNLQKLADIHLRHDEIMQSLKLALEATHNHPKRFPLEPWVQRHHQHLFGDPKALRVALLELPAHPALSKLEEELTAHEELLKQLRPKLEEAEASMKSENWGEAKRIAEEVLSQYPQQAPAQLRQMVQEIKQHERRFWQSLQKLPRNPKKRNQLLEGVANDALTHGLPEIADAAFRKLLRASPQYGLGYLKWARITKDPAKRHEAYQKAISLSRTPQQTRNNLDEYVRYLEYANELPKVLPLLLEFAKSGEDTIPRGMIERLLTRISEQHGTQDDISTQIQEFLSNHEQGSSYKRVQRSINQQENMEPWKRALLSIKNKT